MWGTNIRQESLLGSKIKFNLARHDGESNFQAVPETVHAQLQQVGEPLRINAATEMRACRSS